MKILKLLPCIIAIGLIIPDRSFAQTNTFPSSGNVGIGTLSPALKLQTWNSGFTGRVAGFYNDGYLAGHFGYIHIGGSHQLNHYGVEIGYMNEQSTPNVHNSAMVFRTTQQEGPDLTERMRISSGGNVGIGTISPSDRLEVSGAIRSDSWRPFGSISNDFYVDVEPGTRILRTRNYNIGAPNVAATGIHTGSGYFETNVGIGVAATQAFKLAVNGNMIAESVKVALNGNWPDYVFADGYKRRSLPETESFIKQNNHLPDIAPANEMVKNGIDLGEMNIKLLQKIEELTLHLIELKKEVTELKKEKK